MKIKALLCQGGLVRRADSVAKIPNRIELGMLGKLSLLGGFCSSLLLLEYG